MDLSKFNTTAASDQAKTLSLINPFTEELIVDEKGNTLDIHVYGIKSTAARNAHAERERRSNKNAKLSFEASMREGAKFLAAITAGWSANIEMNGEPLKYNHENAVKLYLEQDWIGKQVLDFAQDMANYDPKLKKA